MSPADRLVTSIPLAELWDDRGVMARQRLRWLSADDVRDLLRSEPPRLVVANVGMRLRWIPPSDAFRAWKTELRPHLAAWPEGRIVLDACPDGYCFVASEWASLDGQPIVLFEMQH